MAATDLERYRRAWRDYRWRVAMFFAAWLGLFLAAHVLIDLIGPKQFTVVWFGSFIITSFRLWNWRCPRCSNRFFSNVIRNPFARRCMHCDLPKRSMGPEDSIPPHPGAPAYGPPPAEVAESANETRITVRAWGREGVVSFLRIWVIAWTIGLVIGLMVALARSHSGFERTFLGAWLFLWTTMGGLVAVAYAWVTIGKTVLVASPGRIVLRRQVGLIGRSRELDALRVRKVRLVSPGRSSLIADAAVRLGVAGPTIVLDYDGEVISLGPFSDEADAQRAADAVAGRLATKASAIETRTWRPKWISPLAISSTVLGGLFAYWMGTQYGEQVAGRCSICGPGDLPLVCTFPTFMTAMGTAMVIAGAVATLVWVAWRHLRRVNVPRA